MIHDLIMAAAGGGGGITLVGGRAAAPSLPVGSPTSINLTNLNGGSGPAALKGDLVLVAVSTLTNTANVSLALADSGYSKWADLYSNDAYDTNLEVYAKFMGDVPDATVTTGGGNTSMAVIVYRGVDQANPRDVPVTTATGTNSHTVNPPAITPVTPGSQIVVVGATAYNTFVVAPTLAAVPSELSPVYKTPAPQIAICNYSGPWAGGTYDCAPWTFEDGGGSPADNSWAAATIALRPAT